MDWRKILRHLAIGIPVCFLLFAFWLYLGYRSFSNEIAHANKRLNKATLAALTPAGNIMTMGMLLVAFFAACAAIPAGATIKSTFCWTRFTARSGNRSIFPSAHWYSMTRF